MKLERLLSIVVTLLNKEKVQAAELAEKYEVSIRTIYRDIEAINMAGIPVVSYAGNNGGFCILKNYCVERQFLTFKEMLSIATALKGIEGTKGEGIEATIAKIENLLPNDRRDEYKEKRETLVIDMMPWGMRNDVGDKRKTIEMAIDDRKKIDFEYTNYKGENTKRTIEPMTLVYKSLSWYLFGYCCDKDDYRMFKLVRMKNLCVTEEYFIRKERKYSFDNFENNHKNIERTRVKIRFSNEVKVKVEEYFAEEELIPDGDNCFILETEMMDEEWFYPMIFSYGEFAEVIEPESLRKKIVEKIKKIGNKYQT